MKRGTLILMVGLAAAGVQARPDRNAFLNHSAGNIQAVIYQVQSDAAVRDRYTRHFAMTSGEVVNYLRTLRLRRLPSDQVLQVYSVPPNNIIKQHVEKFRAGTPVYVDMAGNPALIAKCGNPLTRGPENPTAVDEPELTDLNEEVREMPSEMTAGMATDMISTLMPSEVAPPTDPGPLMTTGTSPVIIAPAFGVPNFLLGLVGLGGLGLGLTNTDDTDVEAVPEPTTLLLVSAGAAFLLGRRRRS